MVASFYTVVFISGFSCFECNIETTIKRSDYMTNGDRIRQMSNEELAKFIQSVCLYGLGVDTGILYPRVEGIKAYLESEVEE